MNVQIIYETKSKYTKKIAEGVAEKLGLTALDVADNPVLENVDFLFIVGGWYDGNSNPALLSYVKEIKAGSVKRAALITAAHNYDLEQTFVKKLLLEKNIEFIGERVCPTRLLFLQVGHPNNSDINRMVSFVKEILGMPKYD